MIRELITYMELQELANDMPAITAFRSSLIKKKVFLRQIYKEWYAMLEETLVDLPKAPILELGSGGGFLKDSIPNLITSETFYHPNINVVVNGHSLPFKTASLSGILMTNVLHHLSSPRLFFAEATRCVRVGGVVSMIEPWVTYFSRIIYSRLHYESFEINAPEWESPASSPLFGTNDALAWIVFCRDKNRFQSEFPEWKILDVHAFMPFRYLLSGGVSTRCLMPNWSFGFWRVNETLLSPWMKYLAMFARIVLKRTSF